VFELSQGQGKCGGGKRVVKAGSRLLKNLVILAANNFILEAPDFINLFIFAAL